MNNPLAHKALSALGARLRALRLARNERQEVFAQRLAVSVRTLRRMEEGDPGVKIGTWAEALDVLGRLDELQGLLLAPDDLFERKRVAARRRAS